MSNAPKLKKKAAEFEQKRQFDKALQLYVQVLEEASEEEQVQEVPLFNRVGDLLVRQGNVAEAVNYYEKAVDLYAEGGFFNNAIALCNKILRHAPGRSSVYYKLGKISAKKGFKSDAKQNFLEYADRMQKEGKMDEAFRALKEFADLVPDQDDVRLMLAEQLSRKGRQGEAIDQLQQLYEKFAAEGRSAEAKATLERMQAIDPEVVPKASGAVPIQKVNDLVFLDVSFDEPVQRGGAPPAAPRRTVPMPAFDESAMLADLEPTSAAPAPATAGPLDDLPLLDAGPGDMSLDLGTAIGGTDFDRASTASMLDGLTTTDVGSAEAPPTMGGDFLEIERNSLDDDDRAGLRGGLLDLDGPIAANPPMGADEFDALRLDIPTADAPPTPPPHDLALPGDLPLLDTGFEPSIGGDLPLLMPDSYDARETIATTVPPGARASGASDADASASEPLDLIDAGDAVGMPRRASGASARASGSGALLDGPTAPLDGLETAARASGAFDTIDDAPRTSGAIDGSGRQSGAFDEIGRASGEIAAAGRASGPFDGPPLDDSDLPMLDLGTPSLGDAPLDISPAELDLAAELDVSPADVPADPRVSRASDALAHLTIADADENATVEGSADAALVGDAAGMPITAESPVGAYESPSSDRSSSAFDELVEGLDVSPAELDLASDLGVAPIGTPSEVPADDVDRDEAAAADARDAREARDAAPTEATRTSGPAHRRTSSFAMAAESVETLRVAAGRNSEDWGTRRSFAEALLESGDRDGGMKELELVLIGYERAGDLDSARSVAEEIIRLDPNSVRHHQKRVEYAFRSNDKSRLVDAYNELADALMRAGQSDKAKAVYQRVLGLSPDDIRSQAALSAFVDPVPPAASPTRGSTSLPLSRPSTEIRSASMEATPATTSGGDSDFVNLGDWLREDDAPKSTRMVTEEKEPTGDEQADFADMLKKFKQGVAENVEEEDYASHYDLGVAYKEMGLLDEAISEFQKALRSPDLKVRTYEALGQCFIEKNQFQVATTILGRALSEPGIGDDQLVGVLYLLGFANEALQRKDEAIGYYQRVFAVDIQFRDVAERLNALERAGK